MIVCIYVHVYILCVYIYVDMCVCVRACYINVRVEPPTTLLCISLSYPICACLYWRNRPSWGQLPSTPRVLLAPKSPQVFLSPTVAAVAAAQSNLAEDLVWLQTLPKQPKIIMSIHSKEWNGVSLCNIIIHIYNIQFILCCLAIPSCCWTPGVFGSQKRKKKQASCAKPPSGMCHGRPKFASKILQMLPKGWLEMISETLIVSSRSLVVSGLKNVKG